MQPLAFLSCVLVDISEVLKPSSVKATFTAAGHTTVM